MPYARRNQAGEIVEVNGAPRPGCSELVPEGTVPVPVITEAANAASDQQDREGVQTLVAALKAGTATNRQVQGALARLIVEVMRR